MKNRLKKLIALATATCMIMGCFPMSSVYAEENEAQNETVEKEEEVTSDYEQENLEQENLEQEVNEQAVEEDTALDETEQNETQFEESVIEKNKDQINYVFVESPYLEAPGTERIAVSYGDGTENIQSVVLEVENSAGEMEQWDLEVNADNLYLFAKEYTDDTIEDTYKVKDLLVTDEEGEHKELLSDYEMEALFGVNKKYEGIDELKPLDQTAAEEQSEDTGAVDATVVEINSENPETSVKEIENALENAEEGTDLSVQQSAAEKSGLTASRSTSVVAGTMSAVAAQVQKLAEAKTKSGNYVVAIDPGHDSTHTGATGIGGLKEEVLTLKIANYCKAELEKYLGVSVYMTRTSAACPNPGSGSSGDDIGKRIQAAVKAGADVYVSIHLNSSSSSDPNGAEVIVPNKNWKPQVAEEGTELAEAILTELKAVGVNMRPTEIYSRDTTINENYPDGSKSDYFSVQIYAKEAGIPGIIVEHAFLTNENDVNKFLKTESGLKKLGVADAKGIAKYLGVSKADEKWGSTPELNITKTAKSSVNVSWNSVKGASGYAVYRKEAGQTWSMIGKTSSTTYKDSVKNLNSGTMYYYTVRAYRGSWSQASSNKYKTSYWTSFDSNGTVAFYMTTPKVRQAKETVDGIKITWKQINGATGYEVYRKQDDGSWTRIGTTTKTSYTDKSSLSDNSKYYYTLRAYHGNRTEAVSNKYNAEYWSYRDTTGTLASRLEKLKTPVLKKAAAAVKGIKINWEQVDGASGYAIYRKTSDGNWKMLDTTEEIQYKDIQVEENTTYYYTVRAYRGDLLKAKENKYSSKYWSGFDTAGLKAIYLKHPNLKAVEKISSGYKVRWKSVSGASGYLVCRKTDNTGWEILGTTTSTSYQDKQIKYTEKYYYTVRAYCGSESKAMKKRYSAEYWGCYDTKGVEASAYPILGESDVTVSQMVNLYKEYATVEYPQQLSEGGAEDIQQLAEIFCEEAEDEGIRPEVAWCQAMLETGYLKFGGDVKAEQYNFAGIGATDAGVQGASFSNVREGVRAQIQHLKAYADKLATENNLHHDLVDPRFKYVSKGTAEFVEILGTQENPNGSGWATSKNYGYNILKLIDKM